MPAHADETGWEDAPADDTDTDTAPATDTESPTETETPATPEAKPAPTHTETTHLGNMACQPAPQATPAAAPRAAPEVFGDFELSYGRMALPTAHSTFSATGFPDKTGRELGFENPLLHVVGLRTAFQFDSHLAFTFGMNFAWAKQDTDGTDPQAQKTKGYIFASDFLDLGIEGVTHAGPFMFSAGASAGPRLAMIGMNYTSERSNAVAAFQGYFRPRVSLELDLDPAFSIGAYASDDIIRPTSVGAGVYIAFKTPGFGEH